MTTSEVLHRAASLVEGGWAPCFTLDGTGQLCAYDAEGATLFSITGALLAVTGGNWALCEAAMDGIQAVMHDAVIWAAWEGNKGLTANEVARTLRQAAQRLDRFAEAA
jgi:hypothetical protein